MKECLHPGHDAFVERIRLEVAEPDEFDPPAFYLFEMSGDGLEEPDETIENSLLDAMLTDKPVLFIYAEEQNPEEYTNALNTPVLSHGCAILIKNTGENGYELITNNENIPPLSFQALQESLETKTDIKTSSWILTKKQ